MLKTYARRVLSAASLILIASSAPGRSPAQPHAYEGYGSITEGGVDGEVFHVTSLADKGPGTLREGIAQAKGPRTVVFDVAGAIALEAPLVARTPFLTLKGSSAPAPGVTIRQVAPASGLVLEGTHDVVVEGLRFMGAGDASARAVLSIQGGARTLGASRIVIDHVTVRGSSANGIALSGRVSDVTLSWSLFGLNTSDPRSPAPGGSSRISVHHNVFAKDGIPSWLAGSSGLDVVNNVVYDWASSGETYGLRIGGRPQPSLANIVGNAFVPATASPDGALVYGTEPGPDAEDRGPRGLVAQGSFVATSRVGGLWVAENVLPAENPDQYSTQAAPNPIPALARVTTSSPFDLSQRVLPSVGTSPRDAAETLLLEEVAAGLPIAPSISIGDASIKEGDTGAALASFAVTLSAPSRGVVTVAFSTADGTAAAGSDYKATSGVLTFEPGVTEQSVKVAVKGDRLSEGDETFSVNLSDSANATIAHGQGHGTILDDDGATVSVSAADASSVEGNQGSRDMVFALTLSAPSSQRITVAYLTVDGTAVAGQDYAGKAGTAIFPPGTTRVDVPVAVLGDTMVEGDEFFDLVLSDATGAWVGRGRAHGVILDDDSAPQASKSTPASAGAVSAPVAGVVVRTTAPAAAAAATGATYHVANSACSHGSTACSDSNTGLSRSAPLCTVQAALNKLAPGSADTVVIHSGVYVDDAEVPNWSNTGGASPGSPITIQGASGDPKSGIVLRGTSSESSDRSTPTAANTAVLRIGGKGSSQRIQNIRVKDLTINPGNVEGILVFNGSFVEIDNVDFNNWQGSPGGGNSSAAVTIKGADHVTLKNSNMSNGGVQQAGASGLEITGGVMDTLIYNNVVHDFEGGCTHGSSNGSGKGRVLFAQNDFRNCQGATDETATFQIYNDQDFMFYNNVVEVPANGANEVFSIRRTNATSHSSSAHIIGNTIISKATGRLFAVRSWGQVPDAAVVRNNIFVGFDKNSGSSIIRLEGMTPCSGYDEDYNYVYGLPTLPLDDQSSCGVSWGAHTVLSSTVPPGLDASYAPTSGAPVVDKGDPGLANPVGAAAPKDVGAFDLGAGRFPLDFASRVTTSSSAPTIRWGGTSQSGDVVVQARNRPTTSQTGFRVQIDTVPTFDSQGIWTPLVDSGHVTSGSTSWTSTSGLPAGMYYARLTVSDQTYDQEWSDPFFRFTVGGGGPITPAVSVSGVTVTEGAGAVATLAVTLSQAGTQTVTVDYATSDGTAQGGKDYSPASGTLTFAPGTVSKTVSVPIIDDTIDEDDETFTLTLSNAVQAVLGNSQATGIIQDDDPLPTISIGNASVAEGNTGFVDAALVVTLSAISGRQVTVQYATADGTATAPADYTARSGVLTFAPGTTSQNVLVPVAGDTIPEPNETFAVDLSAATNATGGSGHGVVTIVDDDASSGPDTTAPTGVGNVSPSDGSTGQPPTPLLTAATASDVTGPVSYFFELYAGASCTGTPVQTWGYGTPTGWSPATPLQWGTSYAWRNRARDAASTPNVSAFGPCWTFTTSPAPPASGGAPVIFATDVSSGPVGSFVTFYGRGFTTGGTVTFGGTPATQEPVWSDTKVIVGVPSGAVSGNLVLNVAGTSAVAGTFTVNAGRVLYVDGASGNDGNAGTATAPWKTLAHASATVTAGDVVLIRGGVYSENDGSYGLKLTASGASSSPIVFRGFPGETARITVGGISRSDSVRISGSYNVLTGVKVTDSGMQGVALSGSNNVVFDCEIFNNHLNTTYGTTGSGVNVVLGSQGNKIYANDIHDNGVVANQDHGLYIKGSSVDIAWNDVHNNFAYGAQLYEGAGSTYTGVIVRDNVFRNNAKAGLLVSKGASSTSVYNNVFYGNGTGFQINYTPVTNVTVYNNTSYQNASWEYDLVTGSTVTMKNNIASSTSGNVLRVGAGVSGFASDFNLFGPGSVTLSYNGTTYSSLSAYQSGSGKDASSTQGDPRFVGASSGNFLLQSGSPAIDRGTNSGAPAMDRLNVQRPQGVGWDVGAHEGVGSGTPPPPDTAAPTGVGNVSPSSGATGQSTTPTVTAATATDATGPVSYFFELYAGTACTGSPAQTRAYGTSTGWTPATLQSGATYAWRNKARDAAAAPNESAFGPCWTFTTSAAPDTAAPTGVGNVSPSSGATGQSTTPTVTAATATDATGPVSYFFELYSGTACTGSPAQTRAYGTSTGWTPATLQSGATYAWRNKARDAVATPNESAFGPCWTFTTSAAPDTAAPAGVGNVSPSSGATGQSTTPTVTAATATDATGPVSYFFELYAGTACTGTPAQTRAYGTSTGWTPATLQSGATYAWRNKARDAVATPNESAFGPCWTFTTTAASGSATNVVWTSLVGVSASGNNLTKTAVTGWGNGGAVSSQTLSSGDGAVEVTVTETTKDWFFGLGKGDTSQNYTDVDFGFYLQGNGTLHVYEAGTFRGDFGTYSSGDKLQVSLESGAVKYKKNGTVLYTSTVTPTYPLLVDTSLYQTNATIKSAVVSGNWAAGGAPPPPPPPTAVVWASLVGVTASGNNLTKTAVTGWGNGGAVSSQTLSSGDGAVEVNVTETTKDWFFGLGKGDTNQNYTDVDFGFYLQGNGTLHVYEAGTFRGDFGTYSSGDKLQVSLESGAVKYKKNGTVLYTSTVTPTYPLLVDTSLYQTNATIKSAVVSGNWAAGGAPPPTTAVVWASLVGVTASGNNLTKTAVTGWGNGGAVSSQTLSSGDGAVEVTVTETIRDWFFGLGKGDTSQNYTDVDFGFYLQGNGTLHVYEAGTFRGDFGTYSSGDKLQVSLESGAVKYKKNGTVLYTSTVAPTYPLLVDTSLYQTNATINSAMLSGSWQ